MAQGEETQATAQIPPEEIRARLTQWAKQIENFRMRWEVTNHTLQGAPLPDKQGQFHHLIKEFVWTNQRRFWSHNRDYINREWFTRDLLIHDTEIGYRAEYEEGFSVLTKPAKLTLGVWGASNAVTTSSQTFLPLQGVWDSLHLNWTFGELSSSQIDCQGTEMLAGRAHPYIQLHQGPQIHFDPEHNYLPRRIRLAERNGFTLFVVNDYQEVKPGVWFPVSGYQQIQSGQNQDFSGIKRWRVTEVKINQSIPDAAFRIKPVVGTKVVDTFTGFNFTYGRDMPPGTLDSGLNEIYLNYMRHGGPHPFPLLRPPSVWERWKPLLLLLGLIVCGIILAWRTLLPKGVL